LFKLLTGRLYRRYSLKLNLIFMPNPRLIFASHYTPQRLCALTLCLVLTTIPACAKAGGKNYFPLSDGAKWEYAGRFLPFTGGQYPARATIRIDGTTLIRGRRYYKYVTSGTTDAPNVPMKLEHVRYYRVEAGGIYFLPGNDLSGEERLAMPLPIPVKQRWLSATIEVIAERAGTVEAGGRKYADCLKLIYRETGGGRTTEDYLAPGVGIIKTVYINTTPPQSTFELTLESYHL
jgi:hypothetical protein